MIKYAINLVTRRKLRTFLTSLGITIAVVLLSFIMFGMQDLKTLLTNQFTQMFRPNEIIVTNMDFGGFFSFGDESDSDGQQKKEPETINEDLITTMLSHDDIYEADKLISVMGMQLEIKGNDNTMQSTVISGWDIAGDASYFSDFYGDNLDRNRGEVFIDTKALRNFGITAEEAIGKTVVIEPSSASMFGMGTKTKSMIGKKFEYTISGVVTIPQDRNDVILTVGDAAEVMAQMGGFDSSEEYIREIGYDSVTLTVHEEKVSEIVDWLKDEFGVSTMTSEDMLQFLDTITNGMTIALIMFGIISAIVASIGIINTMIMSIYEQTREIGIAKAIGASNNQVMIVFLIQSGIIGLIGGVLGLLIVFSGMTLADGKVVEALTDAGFTVETFFHFDLSIALIITLSSLLVGVFAGLYPSMKAARLDPIKALRYE